MREKVIEPSEIVVERVGEEPKQDISHVNPWLRFIARFFDYALFLQLMRLITFESGLVPLEYFLWIPIEAGLLTLLGTTPGKFLLGTKVRLGKREKFTYSFALRRSFAVWMRGVGMGVPFIAIPCLLNAYHKLHILKLTTWDRDNYVNVTHYPIGKWRLYLAVFVAAVGILYYYSGKYEDSFHATVRPINEHFHEKIVST